ncbi:hypothetical protein J4457_04595 [Candidatus Woesearchaeota archaeon]|nr:hypothetical protein [Candidatus Woesearchaeota archaeon]
MRARNLSVLVAAVAVGMLAITTCSKPKSVLQPPQTIEGKLIAEAYEEDTAQRIFAMSEMKDPAQKYYKILEIVEIFIEQDDDDGVIGYLSEAERILNEEIAPCPNMEKHKDRLKEVFEKYKRKKWEEYSVTAKGKTDELTKNKKEYLALQKENPRGLISLFETLYIAEQAGSEEETGNLFEEIAQRLKISPGELYAAIGFYQEQKGKEMVTAAPGATGIIYHLPVSITKMNDQELGRYFVRSTEK